MSRVFSDKNEILLGFDLCFLTNLKDGGVGKYIAVKVPDLIVAQIHSLQPEMQEQYS